MFSRLHGACAWYRCRCLWAGLGLWLFGISSLVYAQKPPALGADPTAGTTALGASLLEQGEVAITMGGGFPDVLIQFDFANSKRVNLAMRARLNYNLGFPFFGLHAFVSAPLRIGLFSRSKWTVALQLEPGVWLGGGKFTGSTSGVYGINLGFMIGVSGIVGYQVHPRVNLYWGLELQFIFGWEPEASNTYRGVFGFQYPNEAFFGTEYKLNENFSLFGRVAIGPYIYVGNLGKFLAASGVAASGSLRVWGGVVWRR